MARRRLADWGIGGAKRELSEVVGQTLRVLRITRTSSRQYGPGVEISADVLDPATGELLETGVRFVTFSGPITRDLGAVLGDADSWTLEGDVMLLRVVMAGQAFVLEDADDGTPAPEGPGAPAA